MSLGRREKCYNDCMRIYIFIFLFFSFVSGFNSAALSESFESSIQFESDAFAAAPPTSSLYTMADIQVDGLKRTKISTIMNELEFSVGDSVSKKKLNQAVKNLRGTGLFADVSFILSGNNARTSLKVLIKERWTTIPILKFSSGGGVLHTAVGVFDPNVLGHNLEVGLQYERLANTNSGVAWIRKNRIGNTPYGLDLQFWLTNRIRTKYDPQANEAVPDNGFLHKRNKFYLGVSRRFATKLKAVVSYEYNGDDFSDAVVSQEVEDAGVLSVLPPITKTHFAGIGIEYGEIDTKDNRSKGYSLYGGFRYGFVADKTVENFLEGNIRLLYFQPLPMQLTFAQRFLAGSTSTSVEQYLFYLGGLDRIRGFSDNRFSGRYYWLSNTELRYLAYTHDWVVLEPTAFIDVVNNVMSERDYFGLTAASAGAGLRVILPKLYRFVLRFDYAQPLKRTDTQKFSFGVQQFF